MNEYNPILNTLEEIPDSSADAKKISGLVKKSGTVCGYKLSDGNIVSKQEGVNLAKQGQIKNVGIASRNGTEYLKSIPDETENNNLSNLPTVSTED